MSTKLPTYEGTLEGLGRIMVYCHEHFGKADICRAAVSDRTVRGGSFAMHPTELS